METPVPFTHVTGVAAEVGSTANNYQILARLATGGMAEIFLARGVSGTGVERYCVLKRILRDRATDVHFVRMFLDEARLAAQLQHPNVAQVYDIGKLGDSYFFTMEYVHGETVRAVLHRARSLRREVPHGSILTVIAGAAAGLHHAHGRLGHDGRPLGIVHRDVSPSNLMVSYEGGVKVVDFGVAKAENRAQETRSGTVKGKIAYLSPEQCRGAPVDRRSDLFSLGIVFWEMLTTERLYKRASDFDNMTAIVTEDPIPPSTRRKSIPPELDRISMRLLAKDPDARFQTADELVDALEQVASQTGAMLSSGALGRFLREAFGQRPEPWLELANRTVELPKEGVTVTSEPIPSELAVAAAQSMDLKLSEVRDLSPPEDDDEVPIDAIASPSSEVLTAPAIPVPPRREPVRALPLPPPPPSGVVPLPHGFVRSPEPQPGTSSGAHAVPSSASSSGAHAVPTGSHGSYPVITTQRPEARRSWPLVAIVATAAIVGSLTVWFVMRSSGARPAAQAVLAAGPIDAGEAVELDAAELAASADAVVVDAHVASADALVADAAAPVAVVRDPIEVAMAERRFSDVVAACSKAMPLEQAARCTVAACQLGQDTRARAWHARIAGADVRRGVAAACRAVGVELVPKPKQPPRGIDAGVVDPCAANPMACQR